MGETVLYDTKQNKYIPHRIYDTKQSKDSSLNLHHLLQGR